MVLVLRYFVCLQIAPDDRLIGAVVALGTNTAPTRACSNGRVRVTMRSETVLGATARKNTKKGMADAFPHYGEGPPGLLRIWRGSAHSLSENLTPTRPGDNIFAPMGNIGGWGRGRRGAGWRRKMKESARGRWRG